MPSPAAEGDPPSELPSVARSLLHQALLLREQAELLDLAHDAILVRGVDGAIAFWNRGALDLYGWTADEACGQVSHTLLQTESRVPLAEIEQAVRDTGLWEGELTQVTRSGRRVVVASRWSLKKSAGQPVGFLEINRDVTLRKRIEGKFREAASLRDAILNSANFSIISADADGTIRTMNAAAERWLGYRAEELIGRATPALFHDPEEIARRAHELSIELGRPIQPGFESFVAKAREGQADENEWTYVRKDGTRFPVLLSVTALRDPDGTIGGFMGLATDLTQRRRAETERDRFFTLSLDMMCVADQHGHFTRLNPAWERVLGHSIEELQRRPFLDFVHPDDWPATLAEMARLEAGNKTILFENRYRCKDGSYRWMMWSAAPDLEQGLVYAAARDITEMKRKEEELRQARDAAEAGSRAKSNFLANMSHELRTPLNSVIGFANVLLKNKAGNLRDQDLTYLTRILENGKHLLAVINQVLDLAKVEAGRISLQMESVALDVLVRETLAQMESQVGPRDLRLSAEIPPQLAPILSDAGKLKQVLINLVGNALKFTEKGSVTVRLSVHPGSSAPAALEVIDTGIGISADKQEVIFQAFSQGDSSTSRRYGGTGLGLAISRSTCELLGYRLELESQPGVGSTFRIVFGEDLSVDGSVPPCPTNAVTSAHAVDNVPAVRPSRVLVIDDDPDSRLLLAQHLEECGCQVRCAGNGEEGLRLAREYRPALITLDLLMPGMDGWHVLQALKADPATRAVPVIVVSTVATEKRGSVFGAVEVIDKSQLQESLVGALKRNLGPVRGPVLLIDPDENLRERVAATLREAGYDVRPAATGLDALRLLDGSPPSLVVLDLRMPVLDGWSFLEALRHRDCDPIPSIIVAATGELTPAELDRARSLASAVLKKEGDFVTELKAYLGSMLGGPEVPSEP